MHRKTLSTLRARFKEAAIAYPSQMARRVALRSSTSKVAFFLLIPR